MKRKIFLCCALAAWLVGVLCICWLHAANAAMDVAEGLVLAVKDGDTLAVLIAGQKVNVRLYGIDAPEKKQAFGIDARDYAASLLAGRQITVEPLAVDLYGRTVALVAADGLSLQEALLRAGYAWVYDTYCKRSECSGWHSLQAAAMEAKLGLWQDQEPQPPWLYRKGH